jgi:cell division septum initiation protein DivIVA
VPPARAPNQRDRAPSRADKADRPTLAGLGTRVEHILRLAEENAAAVRGDAQREAEAILAGARQEAERIIESARSEAPPAQVSPTTPPFADGTQASSAG